VATIASGAREAGAAAGAATARANRLGGRTRGANNYPRRTRHTAGLYIDADLVPAQTAWAGGGKLTASTIWVVRPEPGHTMVKTSNHSQIGLLLDWRNKLPCRRRSGVSRRPCQPANQPPKLRKIPCVRLNRVGAAHNVSRMIHRI